MLALPVVHIKWCRLCGCALAGSGAQQLFISSESQLAYTERKSLVTKSEAEVRLGILPQHMLSAGMRTHSRASRTTLGSPVDSALQKDNSQSADQCKSDHALVPRCEMKWLNNG